jgi:hypothetical protein
MKTPAFYETQKINWHVYKGLPTVQILTQINPVHALPTHFFNLSAPQFYI